MATAVETWVGGFGLMNLSSYYYEENGIPFDLSLLVSDGRTVTELKVHKFILTLRSKVFEERLLQTSEPRLEIETENFAAFEVLVKFCYTIQEKLQDKPFKFLMELFKEAEKYQIAELQVTF